MIAERPELLEVCPACGSTELRLGPPTGEVDCLDCGELVELGPYGELEDADEVLR